MSRIHKIRTDQNPTSNNVDFEEYVVVESFCGTDRIVASVMDKEEMRYSPPFILDTPLCIRKVYSKIKESESIDIPRYNREQPVNSLEVGTFIAEVTASSGSVKLLKPDMNTLFSWKELEDPELRTSAILTIIHLLLPNFGIDNYLTYE